MSAAFVVAVCGPPGSGKSSLARALAARLGPAPVLAYDAYERITEWPPETVAAWLAAGAPFAEVPVPALAEDLVRLRRGEPVTDRVGGGLLRLRAEPARRPIVVFDTLLGRAHPATAGLIDRLVWLDLPPDVALARKLRALIGAMRDSGGLAQLDGYLACYESLLRPTYAVQHERVRPDADQVLDATMSLDALADAVVAAIPGACR